MTAPAADAPNLVSVVFVRIDGFARLSVAEQMQRKTRLEALLVDMVGALEPDQGIVLDAPDGQALVVLDNPGAALQVAVRALSASSDQPFRIGLNHGPVRRAGAEGQATVLIGDGLLAASQAAGFAPLGRLFATQAFRKALARIAPQRAQGLAAAGLFTDSMVRSHEMFAFEPHAAGRRRRNLLLIGVLGVGAILASGYGARLWRLEQIRLAQPAIVLLDIKPYADITVDGVVKGRSPPMEQIELKAGPHSIEARFAAQPALMRELVLQPGEIITITHRFYVAPKPAPKAAVPAPEKQEPGFWEKLKRNFGTRPADGNASGGKK